MGLRQTISQWIATIKDTLDFGPEFPASVMEHRATFTEELTKLQTLLEQTQKAAQEKDKLIAQLQAAGTVRGDMVVERVRVLHQKRDLSRRPLLHVLLRAPSRARSHRARRQAGGRRRRSERVGPMPPVPDTVPLRASRAVPASAPHRFPGRRLCRRNRRGRGNYPADQEASLPEPPLQGLAAGVSESHASSQISPRVTRPAKTKQPGGPSRPRSPTRH